MGRSLYLRPFSFATFETEPLTTLRHSINKPFNRNDSEGTTWFPFSQWGALSSAERNLQWSVVRSGSAFAKCEATKRAKAEC